MAALQNINLSIGKGQVFGIIGTSGAGKSTLIKILTSLEEPTEGEIWIAGEEITSYTKKTLRVARKKTGVIFQHFNLFSSRTVLENVTYPLEIQGVALQEREKRAHEVLSFVGLAGKESDYPSALSGGQKQRVAIARALASNPEVLFCDEATSALDPQTTSQILSLLAELNKRLGITIVMITHQMQVIKEICTHMAVLEKGEIVEQGSVADLFALPQHPTTKRFLHNVIHDVPLKFIPKDKNIEVLRLCFRGEKSHEPIISQISKRFDVEINILLGAIDSLATETIGNLVIELIGPLAERQKARGYLEQKGIIISEVFL